MLFLRIFDTQKVNRKVPVLIRVRHLSRQISLATYSDSQQSQTLVTVDERGSKNLKNSIFDYQSKLKMLFLRLIDPQSKTLMTVDERRSISQKNSIFDCQLQSKTWILRRMHILYVYVYSVECHCDSVYVADRLRNVF